MRLRNRTAEERRRQTVCDKRDNNYVWKKDSVKHHPPFNRSFCKRPGARFSKVPLTFGSEKLFYVWRVCIYEQSFNNFENDTIKLSVKKAKLTGLWARQGRKSFRAVRETAGPQSIVSNTVARSLLSQTDVVPFFSSSWRPVAWANYFLSSAL